MAARAPRRQTNAQTVSQPEEIDLVKKEFGAAIAHDIRTPLSVIAGFAKTLRDEWAELSEEEKLEDVDAIGRNAEKLTHILDEVVQAGVENSGEPLCAVEPFDLGHQVRTMVADFAAVAPNPFSVRINDGDRFALGDERRAWRVLANLLSNAVKFSNPAAGIDVEVGRRNGLAEVSVRDRGMGIAADDLANLFSPYARVGAALEHGTPGSGLGLYLSKCLVEAQGGRISVSSHPGSGSTFTYTLPLAGRHDGGEQPAVNSPD